MGENGQQILGIETAGLLACYCVVRRSQPHCGDASCFATKLRPDRPSSRLAAGQNIQPRHLHLFMGWLRTACWKMATMTHQSWSWFRRGKSFATLITCA